MALLRQCSKECLVYASSIAMKVACRIIAFAFVGVASMSAFSVGGHHTAASSPEAGMALFAKYWKTQNWLQMSSNTCSRGGVTPSSSLSCSDHLDFLILRSLKVKSIRTRGRLAYITFIADCGGYDSHHPRTMECTEIHVGKRWLVNIDLLTGYGD